MSDPAWLTSSPSLSSEEKMVKKPAAVRPSFKVILVGDAGVGKTSMFCRMRDPHHVTQHVDTQVSVAVDRCTRTIGTPSGDVTVTLWDTAGAEKYRTLTRNYYRDTHAVLLVFSVNDPSSLYSLSTWQRDIMESSPSAVQFLIGNKCDLDSKVTAQCMRCFADSHNCQAAFLTSAKTGEGMEAALMVISEHLVKYSHHLSKMHTRDCLWLEGSGIQIHGTGATKQGAHCCS